MRDKQDIFNDIIRILDEGVIVQETLVKLRELRNELRQPVQPQKRILLVKSAQCWYNGAIKLWEGKKYTEAFLALENALNHTENALREEMDRELNKDNKQQ